MRSHRGANHRGPSSFSANVFFRGPSPRAAQPPPPKSQGDMARDATAYNTNRLGLRPGPPYGGHGLKLFSLSERFVRVCKTVAKLLAAHSSWSSRDALVCRIPRDPSDELSSFFIRYATHATIPARNRESGLPSRRRRARHFLTPDGSTDNITVANVDQVIRMGKKREMREFPLKKRSMRTINQIAFSWSLSRLDATKGYILDRSE